MTFSNLACISKRVIRIVLCINIAIVVLAPTRSGERLGNVDLDVVQKYKVD